MYIARRGFGKIVVDVPSLQMCATIDDMSYHVYDPFYSQILTIAFCDMQYEDVDSQILMWNSFVKVMKKHSVQNVNFKIFMIDCVQTNFNAIIMLFGSGGPKVLIEINECTCFYHWVNNLLIAT
jgi:hypothetical protein